MANLNNLRSFGELSQQERHEMAIKGANASNKVQKEKKTMRETINRLMELPMLEGKSKEAIKKLGLEDNEINNQTALIVSMYQQALKGNVNAFNSLRDTSGNNFQDVKEQTEVPDKQYIVMIPAKDMASHFVDINRSIDEREYREYMLEGGRGSVKSSYIGEKIIELLENNPRILKKFAEHLAVEDAINHNVLDKLDENSEEIKIIDKILSSVKYKDVNDRKSLLKHYIKHKS